MSDETNVEARGSKSSLHREENRRPFYRTDFLVMKNVGMVMKEVQEGTDRCKA